LPGADVRRLPVAAHPLIIEQVFEQRPGVVRMASGLGTEPRGASQAGRRRDVG
jgi:hypothetical protein